MTTFKMPERLPEDGAVGITRIDENHLSIDVTTNGEPGSLTMSRFNAARVFGFLAVFLEIPLPAKLGKAIKFGGPDLNMTFGPDAPPKNLGERIAANLKNDFIIEEMAKTGITLTKEKK